MRETRESRAPSGTAGYRPPSPASIRDVRSVCVSVPLGGVSMGVDMRIMCVCMCVSVAGDGRSAVPLGIDGRRCAEPDPDLAADRVTEWGVTCRVRPWRRRAASNHDGRWRAGSRRLRLSEPPPTFFIAQAFLARAGRGPGGLAGCSTAGGGPRARARLSSHIAARAGPAHDVRLLRTFLCPPLFVTPRIATATTTNDDDDDGRCL